MSSVTVASASKSHEEIWQWIHSSSVASSSTVSEQEETVPQFVSTSDVICIHDDAEVASTSFEQFPQVSPLSDLAIRLTSQHLDNNTPRRRLSLDTEETVSDTSTTTPNKAALLLGENDVVVAMTPEQAGVQIVQTSSTYDNRERESPVLMRTSSVVHQEICISVGSHNDELSPVKEEETTEKDVMFCVESGEFSETTSPMLSVSPSPSSVFLEDEDSRDSGLAKSEIIPFRPPVSLPPRKTSNPSNNSEKTRSRYRKNSGDMGFFGEYDHFSVAPSGFIQKPGGPRGLADLTNLPTLTNSKKKVNRSQSTSAPCRSTLHRSESYNTDNRLGTFVLKRPPSLQNRDRKSGLSLLKAGAPSLLSPSTANKGAGIKRSRNISPQTCSENLDPKKRKKCGGSKAVRELNNENMENQSTLLLLPPPPKLNRCYSESTIQSGPHHGGYDKTDLIGDYSKIHSLPLVRFPQVKDMKNIAPSTLAKLLRGEITVEGGYRIIDCRYPFEYAGGHVRGAENVHWPDDTNKVYKDYVTNTFFTESILRTKPVPVLIFYCEFSQKRGPKMWRTVRAHDRKINEYPALNYPEIYLLDGGYKNFCSGNIELCDPPNYVPMLSTDHSEEFQQIMKLKAKSKSWSSVSSEGNRQQRQSVNRGLFSRKQSEDTGLEQRLRPLRVQNRSESVDESPHSFAYRKSSLTRVRRL